MILLLSKQLLEVLLILPLFILDLLQLPVEFTLPLSELLREPMFFLSQLGQMLLQVFSIALNLCDLLLVLAGYFGLLLGELLARRLQRLLRLL